MEGQSPKFIVCLLTGSKATKLYDSIPFVETTGEPYAMHPDPDSIPYAKIEEA